MSLKLCPECGLKKEILTTDGICLQCHWHKQDEEDLREFVNTSFPDGIITRWVDTPSYLDKKKNFRYFRIPEKQNNYFDSNKQYEIIVKEAKT